MRAARDSSSAAVRAVCATLATGADGEIGMRKPPGGGPGGLENAPHEWPPWGHKRQLRGGCLVPRYAAGYFLAWSVAATNRHAPQMMSAAAWSFRAFAFMTPSSVGCTFPQFGTTRSGMPWSVHPSEPRRLPDSRPRRVFI